MSTALASRDAAQLFSVLCPFLRMEGQGQLWAGRGNRSQRLVGERVGEGDPENSRYKERGGHGALEDRLHEPTCLRHLHELGIFSETMEG